MVTRDAATAAALAEELLGAGFYAACSEARVRVQLSAAHTAAQLEAAVAAFAAAGKRLGVL